MRVSCVRRESDHGGHCGGEFVGVAGVKLTDGNISVFTVSKGRTNLVPPYPRLRILRDYIKLNIVEAKRLRHVPLLFVGIGTAYE